MPGSLVVDLREGYRKGARDLLEEGDLRALARARVLSNGRREQRAQELLGLVKLYRTGPRQIWAPVLLDVLASGLLARLRRLRIEPPFMDEEDLRQQLVAELLEAAAGMPLPRYPVFLRRRLLDRANQRVRRSLARERRRQARQGSYELITGPRP